MDPGGIAIVQGHIGTLGAVLVPPRSPGVALSIVNDGFETGTALCPGAVCVTGSIAP